jgi:hypothetical protein
VTLARAKMTVTSAAQRRIIRFVPICTGVRLAD